MRSTQTQHALTLVETVVATAVLALVMVAALNTIGATARSRLSNRDRSHAMLLAQDLLAEIAELPYTDPESPGGAIGVESGEGTTDRADFDDIDDYHNWTADPAESKDGTALSGAGRFARRVVVTWCNPSSPSGSVGSETGLKRIEVTVTVDGAEAAVVHVLRGDVGSNPMEE